VFSGVQVPEVAPATATPHQESSAIGIELRSIGGGRVDLELADQLARVSVEQPDGVRVLLRIVGLEEDTRDAAAVRGENVMEPGQLVREPLAGRVSQTAVRSKVVVSTRSPVRLTIARSTRARSSMAGGRAGS
jgi:hypothetical protein